MGNQNQKVWVFYSSKTEPELLTFYADGLAYLQDNEIDIEVIDLAEDTKEAKKFDIKTTPTVLIEKEGEEEQRYEVVSYLNGVLEIDELKSIFG